MNSSYKQNNYGPLITDLVKLYRPQNIIEFGVLEGYSLQHLLEGAAAYGASVVAYDIFDKFPGHHADKSLLADYRGVVQYGDFFQFYMEIPNESIGCFHVDIANDGSVYEFFLDRYWPKLKKGGIALLEGGSVERDKYSWMQQYNKPRIQPVLCQCQKNYFIFEPFPSMTLFIKE